MPAKFEVFKDKKGEFRFRLKAANGETIATGESYPDKAACKRGIASIKKNAPTTEIEDTTDEKATVKKTVKKPATVKVKAAAKPAARPRGRKPKAE